MRLALLATAAALIVLPAFAQAPQKPPTPLEKAIADLNQSYAGMNGNINALGITANDIRDHQIAGVQANIGAVLAAKTQEDADKLAAQKSADDAALAAAKKDTDTKIALQKSAMDLALAGRDKIIAAAQTQHRVDTDKLAALQKHVDDQARQLLHVAPTSEKTWLPPQSAPHDGTLVLVLWDDGTAGGATFSGGAWVPDGGWSSWLGKRPSGIIGWYPLKKSSTTIGEQMCINGPMSPKQLRELPHSEPGHGVIH